MNPRAVEVVAPSRLHFGLLSFGQPHARQFGGVGAMIDRPGLRLTAALADRASIVGDEGPRVAKFARRFAESTGVDMPPIAWRIDAAPPAHSGLGSGTQLGLAVAAALQLLLDRPPLDSIELAALVGRGQRSAIGVHGFARGGLLVEAGKLRPDEISPLVARVPLPEAWRFVLVDLPGARGLCGEAERRAFGDLPAMPPEATARLCDEVLRNLLPAAREGDLAAFGESLYRYGHTAGMCFATAQAGGAFATPEIAALIEQLRAWGIAGVGQSSWGPTVFALCADSDQAECLARQLNSLPLAAGAALEIASPANQGAHVSLLAGDAGDARTDQRGSTVHANHVVA